jgi:hypothetical protein
VVLLDEELSGGDVFVAFFIAPLQLDLHLITIVVPVVFWQFLNHFSTRSNQRTIKE